MNTSRRTAVRMLQASSLESDTCDGPSGSPRAATKPPSTTSTAASQSFRRHSACFPISPLEDSFTVREDSGRTGSSTVPTSPSLVASPSRRATECNTGDVANPSIPVSPHAVHSGQESPHQLSVPLTLLSLHNGGVMRHSPRGVACSRDLSPLASLTTRDSLAISPRAITPTPPGDAAGALTADVGTGPHSPVGISPRRLVSAVGGGAVPAAAAAAGGSKGAAVVSPLTALAPSAPPASSGSAAQLPSPVRTTTGVMLPSARSIKCGGSAAAGTAAAACLPTSASCLAAPATATDVDTPGTIAPAAATSPTPASAAAAAGHTATLSVPPHLCVHRPPTPVCKEDDLLAPMRHMASPSRRRSRFASAADSSLLSAAAAAVAAEEAGLLESPPRASAGGLFAAAGEAAARSRRASAQPYMGGEVAGDLDFGGLGPAGEAERRQLVSFQTLGAGPAVPGLRPGEGLGSPRRLGGLSMTWRGSSVAQLSTVPEETLLPQSRGHAFPTPTHPDRAVTKAPSADATAFPGPSQGVPGLGGGSAAAGAAADGVGIAGGAAGAGGLGHGGPGCSAGLSERAGTPIVLPASLTMGRRARASNSTGTGVVSGGGGGAGGSSGGAGGEGDGRAAPVGVISGGGAGGVTGPCSNDSHRSSGASGDDALSSFMHSFGPVAASGAAAAAGSGVERRCPPLGALDGGPVLLAGGSFRGRIPAR